MTYDGPYEIKVIVDQPNFVDGPIIEQVVFVILENPIREIAYVGWEE